MWHFTWIDSGKELPGPQRAFTPMLSDATSVYQPMSFYYTQCIYSSLSNSKIIVRCGWFATENNYESLTNLRYSSSTFKLPAWQRPMANLTHLQNELSQNNDRMSVVTQYGPVTGGRASNGVVVFLGDPSTCSFFGTIVTRDVDRDSLCSSSQAVHGSWTLAP